MHVASTSLVWVSPDSPQTILGKDGERRNNVTAIIRILKMSALGNIDCGMGNIDSQHFDTKLDVVNKLDGNSFPCIFVNWENDDDCDKMCKAEYYDAQLAVYRRTVAVPQKLDGASIPTRLTLFYCQHHKFCETTLLKEKKWQEGAPDDLKRWITYLEFMPDVLPFRPRILER